MLRLSETELSRLTRAGKAVPGTGEAQGATARPSANKYHARKTEVEGITFDSAREAARYRELLLLQASGEISDLEYHRRFVFDVNGVRVGRYTPDFVYVEGETLVVEDVKSRPTKTEAYGLRKRLMLAVFGIEIRETL